jgi:hypothetical protein
MKKFSTKIIEEIETRILHAVKFLRKLCRFLSKVEKYRTAGQATYNNMEHAHFTLGSSGYKYTLKEYVILIDSPLQQRLHECASTLRYTYTPS